MAENKLIYKKMSLDELVVLAQKEDFKAIEELIKKIQKEVFATLSYMTPNNDRLSDLTQEVLLKVAKYITNLKNPKCFKGWLNHIITNTYYDDLRKQKNKPETIPLDYEWSPLDLSITIEIPDKKSKPIEKIIKNAIRTLPESFRIAIILREFQGLSYEEIANATHASIGTVKSRISRARIKLQEVLKNYI